MNLKQHMETIAAVIANECYYAFRHGRSVGSAEVDAYAGVESAVTAALQEAAKAVADTEVVRMGRGYVQQDDGQGTLNAAEKAIRALIPTTSDRTKE